MNRFFSQNLKHARFAVRSYFDQQTRLFDTGKHLHDGLEIVFVESGRCDYDIIHGENTKTERLKSGDLIVLAPVLHRLKVAKEARLWLLELRVIEDEPPAPSVPVADILAHCGQLTDALVKQGFAVLNDSSHVKESFRRLIALLNTNRAEYVDHYFTQILSAALLLNINEGYTRVITQNPHVALIVEYIARSYGDNISVKSVAAAVNLNPSYMQKMFTKAMGNTVHDYLTQFRVNKAIALMKSTNMAFEDIAAETGFNNRQSFYNAFKSYTGYTPKLFKRYLASPVIDYGKN